jgi:hypothetical protein
MPMTILLPATEVIEQQKRRNHPKLRKKKSMKRGDKKAEIIII